MATQPTHDADSPIKEIISAKLSKRESTIMALATGSFILCAIGMATAVIVFSKVDWPTPVQGTYFSSDFLSAFVPEFLVVAALVTILAMLYPEDLNASAARSFLVPLMYFGVALDIVGAVLYLRGASAPSAIMKTCDSDPFDYGRARRWIHLWLAACVLVVEDILIVGYLYLAHKYTSWTLFRKAMAFDGFLFLLGTMLLYVVGETDGRYPPDGRAFAPSLSRPALSLCIALLFGPRTRARIAECGRAVGMQHVTVGLEQLRHSDLRGHLARLGWGAPNASGNSCKSADSDHESSVSSDSVSDADGPMPRRGTSHHTAKLGVHATTGETGSQGVELLEQSQPTHPPTY